VLTFVLTGSRINCLEPLLSVFRYRHIVLIRRIVFGGRSKVIPDSIPLSKGHTSFRAKSVSLFAFNWLAHSHLATTNFHMFTQPMLPYQLNNKTRFFSEERIGPDKRGVTGMWPKPPCHTKTQPSGVPLARSSARTWTISPAPRWDRDLILVKPRAGATGKYHLKPGVVQGLDRIDYGHPEIRLGNGGSRSKSAAIAQGQKPVA